VCVGEREREAGVGRASIALLLCKIEMIICFYIYSP
jgi:hypothetical protein